MSIPADVPRKSKEIPPEVGKILESIEVLLTSLKGKLYESADAPNEGLENGIFRFSGKDKGNPGSRQPLARTAANFLALLRGDSIMSWINSSGKL